MKKDLQVRKFNDTERIIHHLMLHSYFISDIGLLHGQMGVILALSEYSKHTGNPVYFEAASYLLDNVLEKINKELPFSFSSGLSGIGWGIEYPIQEGFVEGESDEICSGVFFDELVSFLDRKIDKDCEDSEYKRKIETWLGSDEFKSKFEEYY